jgi:hypothetical protein
MVIPSLEDYSHLSSSIRGYDAAIFGLYDLGTKVSPEADARYFLHSAVRQALRLSRLASSRNEDEPTLDLRLQRELPIRGGIPYEAAWISFPVHEQLYNNGMPRDVRVVGDIGLFAAYLQGSGLPSWPYERKMEDKYEQAWNIAKGIMRSIEMSFKQPRGHG